MGGGAGKGTCRIPLALALALMGLSACGAPSMRTGEGDRWREEWALPVNGW